MLLKILGVIWPLAATLAWCAGNPFGGAWFSLLAVAVWSVLARSALDAGRAHYAHKIGTESGT